VDTRLAYRGYVCKKRLFLAALAVAAAAAAILALGAGSAGVGLRDLWGAVTGSGPRRSAVVLFNLRLPRVVTALVGGAGLAASGLAMQGILRNPLASASTLGISQGAAFGASFTIIALGAGLQNQTLDGVTILNPYLVSACAFASSMLSTAVVLALSRARRASPEAMVLAGVALSALFSGATTLLQYFAEDVKIAAVVFWSFGDLGRASWREIAVMSAIVALSLAYHATRRWSYNALQSGEDQAKGLGVDVERTRLVGMFVSSLTAAVIVSYVGIINFIGLVAPHMARRVVGSDYRYLLPASTLMGALLLLLADSAGRLVVAPVILPIGAITSFLGAPLFLYMLFKRKGAA